jgi:hypothetical protein
MITIPNTQRHSLRRFATGFHEVGYEISGFSCTRTALWIQEYNANMVNTILITRTNLNPKDIFQVGWRKMFSLAKKHPSKLLVKITDDIPWYDSQRVRCIKCLVVEIASIFLFEFSLTSFFWIVLSNRKHAILRPSIRKFIQTNNFHMLMQHQAITSLHLRRQYSDEKYN